MVEQQQISLEDLIRTKSALENDMEFLVSSQGRLQDVQNRFLTNITSLFELEHAKVDHEVMVPITNTVYAAGWMVSKDKVTIDVGTGYYVEMALLDAIDYYKRKIELLRKETGKIEKAAEEKKGQLMLIYQALQQVQKAQPVQ